MIDTPLGLVATLAPTRQALFTRMQAALSRMLAQAGDSLVVAAIAAPTGSGALALLVGQFSTLETTPEMIALDPLAGARARVGRWRLDYLAATPTLTAGEVSELLGVTTEALRKRDRSHTIVSLPLATGKYAYPSWQFVDGRVVAGLSRVWTALGEPANGWDFSASLDSYRETTGATRTLRQMLCAGDVDGAVGAARAVMEADGGA
jgi:hypothetical protein